MIILFLALSILAASIRNIFSKRISDLKFGTKGFFRAQSSIFLCGSVILAVVSKNAFSNISMLTVLYGAIYGALLMSAQYCYTASLKSGNVGICSTVYSLGFVLPTLSGFLFWNEKLTLVNLLGIITVITTIIISGSS